jgi:ankyrin repeat protein
MHSESGKVTLNAFLNYFSSDTNHKMLKEPDYNKQDNRKRTILHRAAASGHIGVVRGLLNIQSINPNQLEKDQ